MDINKALNRFNVWWDVFILEAIKPAAILSMGLGTVAIFNLQGLAISPWFVSLWAIVQAVSIDGLFFATWDRLFSQKLKKANAWAIIGLTLIGLTLALIAVAINAILGFQVLWAIADSQSAMARLGIDPALFTAIRAVLAVTVFIMMAYVRSRARVHEPLAVSPEPQAKPARVARVVAVREAVPVAIPEVAMSHNDGLIEPTGANSHSPKGDLIRDAIARSMANGEKPNLKAIASEVDAGYSTVKLYASKMRKETDNV